MAAAGAWEFLIILVLGGSSLFPLGVPPLPEDAGIVRIVPPETLIWIESRGTAEADPASANQAEQLLAEPEVRAFAQAVTREIEAAGRRALQRENAVLAQELPVLVRALLTRPVAVFLERLEVRPGGPPDVRAGLVLSAGDRADGVERSLRALAGVMGGRGSEPGPRGEQVAGAEIHGLPVPPGAPAIAWGRRRSYLFVGIGEGTAASIARRLAGEGAGDRPAWLERAREKASVERPGVIGYADVARLLGMVPVGGMARARAAIDALGLGAVQSVMTISGLDGRDFVSKTVIETRGELRGLLAPFRTEPLDRKALAAIPADATLAIAGRVDLEALYREILDAVTRVDPRARERMARGIARVESGLGIGLSEDLLQAVGDTWRIYSSPSEGGLLVTGLTVVVDVRDEARLARTLERLASLVQGALAGRGGPGEPGIPPRTMAFRGHTIRYVDLFAGEGRWGGRGLPLAPAWSFADGELVISLFPQMVKAYLARKGVGGENAGPATLADLPEIRALWEGGRAPIAVGRIDTRAFFRLLYPLLPPAAEAVSAVARGAGIDIPVGLLPSARAIEPHLLPAVSAVYRTEDGILVIDRGSVPAGGAIAPLALASVGLAYVRAQRVSRAPGVDALRRDEVDLHEIGAAVRMYRLDRGAYPPSLKALIGGEYLKAMPRDAGGREYIYRAPEHKTPPRDRIIAASPIPRGGYRQVLVADGTVRTVTEAEFRRRTGSGSPGRGAATGVNPR